MKPDEISVNILNVLDESQALGEFPHLGTDSHWLYGKVRCCTFRNFDEWLILLELVAYHNGIGDFINTIYAYGNKITKNGVQSNRNTKNALIMQNIGLHVPFVNSDWCPDPLDFEIKVNGVTRLFKPTEEEYEKLNIDLHSPISGEQCLDHIIYVLRFLSDKLTSEELFYPSPLLLDYIDRPRNLPPFLFIYEWCHPGKGKFMKPSESPCLQNLAKALAFYDPKLYYCDRTIVNTHWSSWSDFLES